MCTFFLHNSFNVLERRRQTKRREKKWKTKNEIERRYATEAIKFVFMQSQNRKWYAVNSTYAATATHIVTYNGWQNLMNKTFWIIFILRLFSFNFTVKSRFAYEIDWPQLNRRNNFTTLTKLMWREKENKICGWARKQNVSSVFVYHIIHSTHKHTHQVNPISN